MFRFVLVVKLLVLCGARSILSPRSENQVLFQDDNSRSMDISLRSFDEKENPQEGYHDTAILKLTTTSDEYDELLKVLTELEPAQRKIFRRLDIPNAPANIGRMDEGMSTNVKKADCVKTFVDDGATDVAAKAQDNPIENDFEEEGKNSETDLLAAEGLRFVEPPEKEHPKKEDFVGTFVDDGATDVEAKAQENPIENDFEEEGKNSETDSQATGGLRLVESPEKEHPMKERPPQGGGYTVFKFYKVPLRDYIIPID